MVRLYGSCFWDRRYANGHGKTQWKTEMRNIANGLNYTGKVTGFDTSSSSHTAANETTYLEYRVNGNKCRIFYKRTSKIAVYKPKNVPLPGVQRIAPDPANLGQYRMINPAESKNIYGAMVGTESSSGQMHEVGFIGKHSFDIP